MKKLFPGIDADVLDGIIADRHGEIIAELSWTRIKAMAVLQTTAPYDTGTVAVTNGSASVTLTGGTWTTAMTGRAFRVGTDTAYYEFTYASATTGTLDRVYEGTTDSAADYSIWQSVYPLPSNCRIIEDDAFSTTSLGPLHRVGRESLNFGDPSRSTTGTPTNWATYMDDSSTPPRMQVELWPVPDEAIGIPFEYVAEASAPTQSSVAFAPWMEPASALVEGVIGKIMRTPQFRDYAGAQIAMAAAEKALATMRNNEAHRKGTTQMVLGSHFTNHRMRYGC